MDKLVNIAKKLTWRTLALLIVFAVAGPELIISMELMALVELMGASTFVLCYFSGLRLYLEKLIGLLVSLFLKFNKFESSPNFFLPTFKNTKLMPSLIVHAIPERAVVFVFMALLTSMVISVSISVPLI